MRKLWVIILIIIIMISGFGVFIKTKEKSTYLYTGKSQNWFATYTISKVNSSYFDSLYIQYVVDRSNGSRIKQSIGSIEYELDGTIGKIKSSYPQNLKGIGNFHTASETNATLFNIDIDKEVQLIVKWNGKSEVLKLRKEK